MSSWIAIALLSAAVGALVSIFDKTVIYRYARSPLTLPLLIGFSQTAIGIVVFAGVRLPDAATLENTAIALLSGVIFGLAGQLHMRVLYSQEVSRTIPVTQTAPLFAALIALTFLDESISLLQWAAIVATVVGAVLLSVRTNAGPGKMILNRSFYVLMLGALIQAVANVTGKIAVDELPVLYTHAMRSLGLGAVFLIINARPAPLREVRGYFADRSPALLLAGVNELVVANTGLILLLWALSLAPVSLVTALIGTRALFVVAYSTGLALVWKGALGEQTTPGVLAVKLGATGLIVAGVAGIAV